MGDYLEVPSNKMKAKQLVALHGAVRIMEPPKWMNEEERGGWVWICVVSNATFDAALIVTDESEYNAVMADDSGRPRAWLKMNRELVIKLNPRCEKWLR